MTLVVISEKGQITLPSALRRKLGIKPRSRVEVELREHEIIVRPVKTVRELYGALHEYAEGKTDDWETVRRLTEQAVAEEVANEDKR